MWLAVLGIKVKTGQPPSEIFTVKKFGIVKRMARRPQDSLVITPRLLGKVTNYRSWQINPTQWSKVTLPLPYLERQIFLQDKWKTNYITVRKWPNWPHINVKTGFKTLFKSACGFYIFAVSCKFLSQGYPLCSTLENQRMPHNLHSKIIRGHQITAKLKCLPPIVMYRSMEITIQHTY